MRQSLRLVRPVFAIITLACGLAAAPTAHAQITIGGTGGSNAFPFGTNSYVGEYQQIYAASAFPGVTTISSISFSSATGSAGLIRTDNVTLSLSNTTATPSAPGTNYAGNKGANFTTVYNNSLIFTAASNNTFDLVFPITPFTFSFR